MIQSDLVATVWDTKTGEKLVQFEGYENTASGIDRLTSRQDDNFQSTAMSGSGDLLVSGRSERNLVVWNGSTGNEIWKSPSEMQEQTLASSSELTPDAQKLITAHLEMRSDYGISLRGNWRSSESSLVHQRWDGRRL